MKSDHSADFIRNMSAEADAEPAPPVVVPTAPKRSRATDQPAPAAPTSRVGLKHIGGYVDTDTVEKVALLRVRLKLDNSELIKRAIDELYARHHAKRAFGDAD
jgi:hypothetical protein